MLQHPVPNSLLVHIGDMTVSFALLESTIQSLTWSLIREHQRIGQIITSELSFRNLRALLISLYVERHGKDSDYDALRALMIRSGQLEEERNKLTHSVWAAGSSPDTITRIKITAREKHGFKADFEQYDEDRLHEVADGIKTLAAELQRFHIDLLERGKVVNNPSTKMW
jgi:hypothetical protein